MKQLLDKLAITLDIGDVRCLFLALDRTGMIYRQGGGSVNHVDTLFVGKTDEPLFEAWIAAVPEVVLARPGTYVLDPRTGDPCTLTITIEGLQTRLSYCFHYGTQSEAPHRLICDMVTHAIDLTEPWYQSQRS